MPHRRTRWFLRTVAVSATLTLGAGVAQVAHPRPVPRQALVAAPAPAPAGVLGPTPPGQDDEVPLHPKTTPPPVSRPRVVVRRPAAKAVAPRPHRVVRAHHAAAPTFEQQVRREVARLPFYRPGIARWVVAPGLSNYGLTNMETRTVYLSPRIPRRLLYSVVAHEWGHVISTRGYGGDLVAADAAMLRWFGGGSMSRAVELAADCIARVLGARWTHYTACNDSHSRYGARYLMVGWKLPEQQAASA